MEIWLGPVLLASEPNEDHHSSLAMFCPVCGTTWGRIRRKETWDVLQRACPDHPYNSAISGSFFQDFDWGGGIEGMMSRHPSLLEHELRVHVAWAERFGLFTLR